MAEIGLIASVLQAADIGIRLGVKLYHFGQAISTADDTVSFISKDISHTSCILKELAKSLEEALEVGLCSQNAYRTADSLINECRGLFKEMDEILVSKLSRIGSNRNNSRLATATFERLKWPFLQPKIKLLSGKLSKLTSTLHLMLNVMIYAKQVVERTEASSAIDDQRVLIDDLIRINTEQSLKFAELRSSLTDHSKTPVDQVQIIDDDILLKSPEDGVSQEPIATEFEPSDRCSNNEASRQWPRDCKTAIVHDCSRSPRDQKTAPLQTRAGTKSPTASITEVQASTKILENANTKQIKSYCRLIDGLLTIIDNCDENIRFDTRDQVRRTILKTHRVETRLLKALHGSNIVKDNMQSKTWELAEVETDSDSSEDRSETLNCKSRAVSQSHKTIALQRRTGISRTDGPFSPAAEDSELRTILYRWLHEIHSTPACNTVAGKVTSSHKNDAYLDSVVSTLVMPQYISSEKMDSATARAANQKIKTYDCYDSPSSRNPRYNHGSKSDREVIWGQVEVVGCAERPDDCAPDPAVNSIPNSPSLDHSRHMSPAIARYLNESEDYIPQLFTSLMPPSNVPSDSYAMASSVEVGNRSSGTSMMLSSQSSVRDDSYDDLPAMTDSSDTVTSEFDIDSIPQEPISLEKGVLIQDLTGALIARPGPDFHSRLVCPLRNLNCSQVYSQLDEWIAHSLTHFHGVEPPLTNYCILCEWSCNDRDGYQSWASLMNHLAFHYDCGHSLSYSRPDFTLSAYLFDAGILTENEYREFSTYDSKQSARVDALLQSWVNFGSNIR